MRELKPCPFCGGEGQTQEVITNRDEHIGWKAYCENEMCFASCNLLIYHTEAEAIAAWNTRAERTCELIDFIEHVLMDEPDIAELSCGHDFMVFGEEDIPNYCPSCGAKVVK